MAQLPTTMSLVAAAVPASGGLLLQDPFVDPLTAELPIPPTELCKCPVQMKEF